MTVELEKPQDEKVITLAEIGWVAGIIDLKGRIAVKNNATRNTPQVILYVESKNHEVVRRLARDTGMRPEPKTERPLKDFMRRSCSVHCPSDHVHVGSKNIDELSLPSLMRWTITGAGIVVIMHSVLPYLTLANQIKFNDLCAQIKAYTPITGPGSGAVLSTIRRLYFAGWPLPQEYMSAVEE
jgi:hypothetical protein